MFSFGRRQSLGELRQQMDAAIKQTIVPQLRASGFQGSYPHFRRLLPERTDLLRFRFNKYGGAFLIHIASAPGGSYTNHHGEIITPANLKADDLPFDNSLYLRPMLLFFLWFPYRFHNGQIDRCIRNVQKQLPKAELWWAAQKHER